MKKAWTVFTKRTVCMILAFLVLISTTACSAPAADKGNSAEKTKVVFWNIYYNNYNETDKDKAQDELFINRVIKEYEEQNPNIDIEIYTPPVDNYYNLLKAACVAQNGPDIAMTWTGGSLLDFSQYLEPLDSYFTEEEQAELMGWEFCREDLREDGAILGVPLSLAPVECFYYNKALFREAGVDPERRPETWDEFLELCEDLKNGGVLPFVTGDKEGWNTAWALSQLWGGQVGVAGYMDVREGRVSLKDNPELTKAYEAWKELYDRGYTNPDALSLSQSDGQARFLAGEGAIEIGMSMIAKDVYAALGEDAGWFPYPNISEDAPYGDYYFGGLVGNCFTVPKYSKVKDEAIAFIKYLTSKDVMDRMVDEVQLDFSNRTDAKEPAIEDNPLIMELYDYTKETTRKPLTGWDNVLQGDLCQEIYSFSGMVFTGKMSVEEALTRFDEKYKSITAEN